MEKELKINYLEYSPQDLPQADKELLAKAAQMAQTAYAPYSHFKVGAALRLKNGKVITGSNQENAAYPSGLCAERVAVFSAAANHPDQPIEALAITVSANKNVDHPIAPCGACRQSILEYEHKFKEPIRVILRGSSGKIAVFNSIESLLPFQFNSDELDC
ncbi:MAG: cytidine deaminase [Bacteroidales bacterium]|nr:cytidine deaminase [Bacteroidales bacterium]MDE7072951.1 cytidine deaminase [Bacteroidales bacterium]